MKMGLQLSTNFLPALIALSLFSAGSHLQGANKSSSNREDSKTVLGLKLIIRVDHEKYSVHDPLELSVALRNDGDSPIYLDRRMFWGYGGGLFLEIFNQHGDQIKPKILDDAIMPPPLEKDSWVLTRLDEGFFYGTSRTIRIQDYFTNSGRYQIRVKYKSWLRKEYIDPSFRDLRVVWASEPAIESEPIWIEVVQ